MVRYLVKTQTQSWGALDEDQIQRLVSRGHVGPDAFVRDVPDGTWVRMSKHPVLAALLEDTTPQPRHIPRTSREGPPRIWVKTPQSIVQVRDRAMLERLCVMGVLAPVHGVSHDRSGPFSPLGQHPDFQHLFVAGEAGRTIPAMNAGALPNKALRDPALQTPISQDVIALQSADLEPVSVDSDVIALTTQDFERIDAATSPSAVALSTPNWEAFRRKMNATSERLRQGDNQHDLTWDLFRSMMERAEPQGGPSEHTWNRFRHRIQERANASGRKETTWDRFRHLIHDGPHPISNQTWALFVQALRQRRARASHRPVQPRDAIRWPRPAVPRVGQAIVGEARIKSMVVRRDAIRRSPSIELQGLKVKSLTPDGSSKL